MFEHLAAGERLVRTAAREAGAAIALYRLRRLTYDLSVEPDAIPLVQRVVNVPDSANPPPDFYSVDPVVRQRAEWDAILVLAQGFGARGVRLNGSQDDMVAATRILAQVMSTQRRQFRYLRAIVANEAKRIVDEDWRIVRFLATNLIERRRLTAEEVSFSWTGGFFRPE